MCQVLFLSTSHDFIYLLLTTSIHFTEDEESGAQKD